MFAKPNHSYSILCVNKLKEIKTPEKAARVILESLDMDSESFRYGSTKVLINSYILQTARSLFFRLLFRVINPNYNPKKSTKKCITLHASL